MIVRDDLTGCIHYALQSVSAGGGAASTPHSNKACDDALNGASVEGSHDGGWDVCSPWFVEEV